MHSTIIGQTFQLTLINSLGPKFSSQGRFHSTTLKRTPVSVFSAC